MYSKTLPRQFDGKQAGTEYDVQSVVDFPTVRYFQIHFAYLQEQLKLTLLAVDSLQKQVKQLEQQFQVIHHQSCCPGFSCEQGAVLDRLSACQEQLKSLMHDSV